MKKFNWAEYEKLSDNPKRAYEYLKKYARACHTAFENGEKLVYDDEFYEEFLLYDEREADTYLEDCELQNSKRRCMNDEKTLIPLEVYLFLRANPQVHYTQVELMRKLPVKVERKAFARHLHLLSDVHPEIRCTREEGVWFDPDWKIGA